MDVVCPSCAARYRVSDEKVRGKKFKAVCKHCRSTLIVDGTTLPHGEAHFVIGALAVERGYNPAEDELTRISEHLVAYTPPPAPDDGGPAARRPEEAAAADSAEPSADAWSQSVRPVEDEPTAIDHPRGERRSGGAQPEPGRIASRSLLVWIALAVALVVIVAFWKFGRH